jgi:DNA-binding MarR family transcriptional regulator
MVIQEKQQNETQVPFAGEASAEFTAEAFSEFTGEASAEFTAEPHAATMLVRELLERSGEYTEFMQDALSVNETDFKAMGALMDNGPMAAGDLAKAIGVSPGAATTVIDRLVAVGHATREQNPKDRRGIVVVPNPASVESAWGHLAPIIATSEATIRGLEPEAQKAVVVYLESMIQAFTTH